MSVVMKVGEQVVEVRSSGDTGEEVDLAPVLAERNKALQARINELERENARLSAALDNGLNLILQRASQRRVALERADEVARDAVEWTP